jgi:carbonic anhydrase/acetyltransferase-like protein (isoleucine patch superfamily)
LGHIGPHVIVREDVYIHESAYLYGTIIIEPEASVWIGVAIRAEFHHVQIGARSNIQDQVVIHVGYDTPTVIGEDCSITHQATLHGCTIGDRCLIGINATIMDGAEIGANSVVAGHSIVTENARFPKNSIIAGVPAKVVATRNNARPNLNNAEFYRQNARLYGRGEELMDIDVARAIYARADR